MLSNEELNEIMDDCGKSGHKVKIRDIAYFALCNHFKDESIAYRCIFGNPDTFEEYKELPEIKFLDNYIRENNKLSHRTKSEEITFQENKKAIEDLIKDAKEMYYDGKIDGNQYLQRSKDLRTLLNDKFNVQEEHKDQTVIVENKYSDICPYCHHEICVPSEEELIQKYGLIKQKNI